MWADSHDPALSTRRAIAPPSETSSSLAANNTQIATIDHGSEQRDQERGSSTGRDELRSIPHTEW